MELKIEDIDMPVKELDSKVTEVNHKDNVVEVTTRIIDEVKTVVGSTAYRKTVKVSQHDKSKYTQEGIVNEPISTEVASVNVYTTKGEAE